MASENPKVNKQGIADKRTHVTIMIPQKLQIIKRLESGKCCGMIHLIINHLWYKKYKDQLQIFMSSSNNFGQDSYFFIIWHLSSPMCARSREFNISPL
jgi:hypothetical protein